MICGDRIQDAVLLRCQDHVHGWEAYKLDSIDGLIRAVSPASYGAMGASLESRHHNRLHRPENFRYELAL